MGSNCNEIVRKLYKFSAVRRRREKTYRGNERTRTEETIDNRAEETNRGYMKRIELANEINWTKVAERSKILAEQRKTRRIEYIRSNCRRRISAIGIGTIYRISSSQIGTSRRPRRYRIELQRYQRVKSQIGTNRRSQRNRIATRATSGRERNRNDPAVKRPAELRKTV